MRRNKFNQSELVKIEHSGLGTVYVPKLTLVQLYQFIEPVREFSRYLAEGNYAIDKEFYENQPAKEDFSEKDENGKSKHDSLFWEGKDLPKNAYEEKIYNSMTTNGSILMLTMFLCNEKGECICPFTERMGEDISQSRWKLYESFGVGGVNSINDKIVRVLFQKDEIEQSNLQVEESPNAQSPKEKLAKKKAKD